MSLPTFSTQSELFSTAGLSATLFASSDRYRLFGKLIYPKLAAARAALEKCYCPENGRIAIEPVLMLGVSLLQELDGVPDRQAIEMLRYHAGWNFALNRQLGDAVFHPKLPVRRRVEPKTGRTTPTLRRFALAHSDPPRKRPPSLRRTGLLLSMIFPG